MNKSITRRESSLKVVLHEESMTGNCASYSGTTLGTVSLWEEDFSRQVQKAILYLSQFPENPGACLKAILSISSTTHWSWAMLTSKTQFQGRASVLIQWKLFRRPVLFPFWAFFILNILSLLWKQWKALISVIIRMHQIDFQKQRNTVKQKANFSKALNM